MKGSTIAIIVVLAGVFLVAINTLFAVEPVEQVLITQFGKPIRIITKPGLHAKIPFIQTNITFDRRLLDADLPDEEVVLNDQRRLIVQSFVRFRITDPLQYYQAVGGTEEGIRGRLDAVVSSAMRQVLGNIPLSDLLSKERDPIMGAIRDETNQQMEGFGITVVDVRILSADLPDQNTAAVLSRMQADREQIAAEARAEGNEASLKIRADADMQQTVLLADANAAAAELQGEGEAAAIKIYANAYSQDPQFYGIWRTLQAYEAGLAAPNTHLVLTPNDGLLKYLATPPDMTQSKEAPSP
jgi:membrane protease subunit HflC